MVTDATEVAAQPGEEPPVISPESVPSDTTAAIEQAVERLAAAPEVLAPEPAVPTAPVPPSIQNLSPEAQEYVSRLEERDAANRAESDRRILDQTVQQYAQQLEQQYNLPTEVARTIAQQQGDIVYQQYQSARIQKAQVRAAISIAKEFNVDPLQLLELPSPQAMRQAAQSFSATSKQSQEIADLRAQLAKLTKGSVPAQTFTQGAQPGAGAGLTGDALEAAWLKHETTQPNRPNPYDSAYRAMLRG